MFLFHEEEWDTSFLGSFFKHGWQFFVWKVLLCGWIRRALPSCYRASLLSGFTQTTGASNSARWSDMHQHDAALECAQGEKIEPKQIQNVLVKKPKLSASFNKYIKCNLYSPAPMYGTMTKEHFNSLQPKPLFATLVPSEQDLRSVSFVPSKFGNVPKGCLISYQQKMSSDYVINDFTCTAFPELPLESAKEIWKKLGYKNKQLLKVQASHGIFCERTE